MKRVLITGANGFIGGHVIARLRRDGVSVRALVHERSDGLRDAAGVEPVRGDVRDVGALRAAADGADAVLHLAGRVHALSEMPGDARLYDEVNVEGTRNVLEAALDRGVGRVLFFSSVKAMGEGGPECLDESAEARPTTAYGRSKLAAEELVLDYAKRGPLHAACLRLPVVYGPHNKGNLSRMIEAIDRGLFPPLPDTGNRRSMVHVANVVEAAVLALTRPAANGQRYIVTDARPYSTRELYEAICRALGRRVPAWSVPLVLLEAASRVGDGIGRLRGRRFVLDSDALEKLVGSAWYSSGKIARELGYRPVLGLEEALPELITWYRAAAGTARPVAAPPGVARTLREPVLKRPFDCALAALGLVLSLPVWLACGAWIWLEDGAPIFFRQRRIGKNGRLFSVLKFRSMIKDPGTVEVQAGKNDPRITRVGRVLRKTAVDELPQLWNIFIGDMSFVGPRAQPEKERVKVKGVEEDVYIPDVPGYELRQLVRPGLTGVTQIFAPRDVPHSCKFKYDLIYVRRVIAVASRASITGDLRMFVYDVTLILRSIWITLRGKWEV